MIRFDLSALRAALRGRVGVAATPAAWIPELRAGLLDRPDVLGEVRAFLALEHGLRGELQDGVLVQGATDPRSGLPVFSFYGDQHQVPDAFWDEVDTALFCAQDVSHRAYTFHQALADLLRSAAARGKRVVVLDRPAPLAWLGARGPSAAQFFPLPFPVLPGLTHGELGWWLNQTVPAFRADCQVIPVTGWRRRDAWAATGLPWIPPSPNIPTAESALAYACSGLIQATNVAEGRGTCKPFEWLGAPFLDGARLAAALNARELPGVCWRECLFQPGFNKFAGQLCGGVHLLFTDARRVDPIRVSLTLLQELARLAPAAFQPAAGLGAWLDGTPWDGERLRGLDLEAWLDGLRPAVAAFTAATAPYRLYPD